MPDTSSPQMTWGYLKSWAASNKIPDDAVMVFYTGQRDSAEEAEYEVHDVDNYDAEEAFGDEPATPATLVLREFYDG